MEYNNWGFYHEHNALRESRLKCCCLIMIANRLLDMELEPALIPIDLAHYLVLIFAPW